MYSIKMIDLNSKKEFIFNKDLKIFKEHVPNDSCQMKENEARKNYAYLVLYNKTLSDVNLILYSIKKSEILLMYKDVVIKNDVF